MLDRRGSKPEDRAVYTKKRPATSLYEKTTGVILIQGEHICLTFDLWTTFLCKPGSDCTKVQSRIYSLSQLRITTNPWDGFIGTIVWMVRLLRAVKTHLNRWLAFSVFNFGVTTIAQPSSSS
jgi:hypothetical protein